MTRESIEERIENERKSISQERKTMLKDAIIVIIASAILATFLIAWKAQITGFQTLQTFDSEYFVHGSSDDNLLRFERVPNFIAKVGEEVHLNVEPNRDDVMFSDNTLMFEITQEGAIEFVPRQEDVGRHNVLIIINDIEGHIYIQNVVIIIEE
jgi:hypothetical protein